LTFPKLYLYEDFSQARISYAAYRNDSKRIVMTDEILHSELQENLQAMKQENTEKTEVKPEKPRPGEIESIETEIDLKEVNVDPENLNNVTVDNTENNLNRDKKEIVSDRSPELTQSYGTGLEGKPTDRAGTYIRRQQASKNEAMVTGGDIDVNYEQGSVVGDEAVGGTAVTPDQNIVDNLGAAVGLEMSDRSSIHTNEILEKRDNNRWELDPQSSDNYEKRQND
jgi:hypothetical protein